MDCSLDLSPKMSEIQDIENKTVKLGMKILEGTQTLEEFKDFVLSFNDGYSLKEFLYYKFSSYNIYGYTADNWRYSVMVKMIVNCFKHYLYNYNTNYNGYYIDENSNKKHIYLSYEEHNMYTDELIDNFNTYKNNLSNNPKSV